MVATMPQLKPATHSGEYATMVENIIAIIGQESDRRKVLKSVMSCALDISGMELGALLVAADSPNNMNIVARYNLPKEITKSLTSGELSQLLLMGKQLCLKRKSMQLNEQQALLGRLKLRYLFGVPFRFSGQVLGAIVVATRSNRLPELSDEQQYQLSVLSQLMALFLDDIRLRTLTASPANNKAEDDLLASNSPTVPGELEQLLEAMMMAEEEVVSHNSDLGLLNDLSKEVIGSLHPDQILEIAISKTCSALQAKASWCYLFEDNQLVLRQQVGLSTGYVEELRILHTGSGVEGMAFSRNETIQRDAALFHSGKARKMVQTEGVQNVMAEPLRANGLPFGVLAIAAADSHQWTARDRRMLTAITRQVERVVIASQRFAEVSHKAESLKSQYQELQQSNTQLSERTQMLEYQILALRQIERQIWRILSGNFGSNGQAREEGPADAELAAALKNILNVISHKEEQAKTL